MLTTKRMLPKEILVLRSTLKLSEGEFASRIGLYDRRAVKLLESGAQKPNEKVSRLLIKLLQRGSVHSPKLKKLLESVKNRIQDPYQR